SGTRRQIKTHIDDAGVVLHRKIDGRENVGEIASAIWMKSFERQNLCGGSSEMNYAGHQGSVTKCGIAIAIDHGGGVLVNNRRCVLVDVRGRTRIAWRGGGQEM